MCLRACSSGHAGNSRRRFRALKRDFKSRNRGTTDPLASATHTGSGPSGPMTTVRRYGDDFDDVESRGREPGRHSLHPREPWMSSEQLWSAARLGRATG